MTTDIPDREAFYAECEDEAKGQLSKIIFPVLRSGFRKTSETGPCSTNGAMLRQRLKNVGVCATDERANELLQRDGLSNRLLDQKLRETRAAFMECVQKAQDELKVNISKLTSQLAAAMHKLASPEITGPLFDSMDPVVVEIYRQWLLNGYGYRDLVFVTQDSN